MMLSPSFRRALMVSQVRSHLGQAREGDIGAPRPAHSAPCGPRKGSVARMTALIVDAKTANVDHGAAAVAVCSWPSHGRFGTEAAPLPIRFSLSDTDAARLQAARVAEAHADEHGVAMTRVPGLSVVRGDDADGDPVCDQPATSSAQSSRRRCASSSWRAPREWASLRSTSTSAPSRR